MEIGSSTSFKDVGLKFIVFGLFSFFEIEFRKSHNIKRDANMVADVD